MLMSNLAAMQQKFLHSILQKDEQLENEIISTDKLPAAQRFSIYQNSYLYRLVDALADNYPSIHTLLGDKRFYAIAQEYVQQYPSAFYNIRDFGHQFSQFLAADMQYHNSVIPEMALFEWSLLFAFDSANALPISMEHLSQYEPSQWGNLKFKLLPSFSQLSMQWNTIKIWQAIKDNADPVLPQQLTHPESWIIWRPQWETKFRSISPLEEKALDWLRYQRSFGEICVQLSNDDDNNSAAQAATLLQQWLQDGILGEVYR